ncbi:endonuclease/exonuclease/phosphatase family protein [Paraferrimonas haliotis]|uniref:Endonuclease n=1 Tax=Paraferrimonas haliotis TaxID=2013866 RepID=A0AA37TQ64_9GAMM|nr:endonuclease/exonuclease/phosphatase family protein [Paraferrimonas haliotis]GLS82576.1 endonuclease [Paraferrimonas haliotis]
MHAQTTQLRVATFNASFDRQEAGQLSKEMQSGNVPQIERVAEIIQRVAPDVLLITEFDNDGEGKDQQVMKDFLKNYLARSYNHSTPIAYPYFYLVATNTGKLTKVDRNGDGKLSLPMDSYGFGTFHGQYAFAVLSQYPLLTDEQRTFQTFLWKNMPNAVLPDAKLGSGKGDYFSKEVLSDFRLSSKNHLDLPIDINGKRLHLLAMHPTPPVFDGPEDRNGRRNHDEIRLFADYISLDPANSSYLVDDQGNRGGLSQDARFVLMGDFNADPIDGDSFQASINQLLNHPRVHKETAIGSRVPQSAGGQQYRTSKSVKGESRFWTHVYPLRLDYVLPSSNVEVIKSGVFWPAKGSKLRYLVEDEAGNQAKQVSSDHRLVWVDIKL